MSFSSPSFLTRAYYRVKPFVPQGLRWALRRRHARKLLRDNTGSWPINEGSGVAPSGWRGWPDGKQFAFILTHDVESQAGVERVRKLAELEMEFGLRSSFNFVPEGNYEVPDDLLSWLVDHGFEVGVHDLHHDGHLFDSRKGFQKKAERINHYLEKWGAAGFRSGFMLRKLEWLHDLKVSYDASTFDTDPFEPQPDGVQTIFPFMVGDGGQSGYLELPYTLPQDSTLFILLREKSPDLWLRKTDWIAERGGLVLPIVHPDYTRFEGEKEFSPSFPVSCYRELLRHVRDHHQGQFWHVLPRELASWYHETYQTGLGEEEPRGGMASPLDPAWKTERATARPVREEVRDLLAGRRVAAVVQSDYPNDPRPRRAAEALVECGAQVEVICVKRNPEDCARLTLNGVNIRRLPMRHQRGGKLTYALQYLGFLFASFAILAARSFTRRYSVVHVHNMPDILVFSALVPRVLGAKVVLDLHDPMPELMRTIYGMEEHSKGIRLLKFLERISIGFAHAVITVNKTCKKMFAARSCRLDKVTVVMNSCDEEMFAQREPVRRSTDPDRPFVVVYTGSLVERNGLGLAIEAIAKVRDKVPNVELRIYGHRTGFLEEMLAKVEEGNLGQWIRYMGPKRIEEIVDAIDECDVGIIPNLRNIFTEINTPTRIFEFLSRGKPVIAPSAPGVLEYFGEKDLVSFELGNADELAARIQFVYENPEEVFEITRRGQGICKAHRWSREKRELIGLLGRLLSPRGAKRRVVSSDIPA